MVDFSNEKNLPSSSGLSLRIKFHEEHGNLIRLRVPGIMDANCDCCGRPVGMDFLTDDEVCGSGDGPGSFICQHSSCAKKREGLSVEARRIIYEANRIAAGAEELPIMARRFRA